MKSEDTRNLFLAIALSVMVMAGWQYFYAGPLYQREHQAPAGGEPGQYRRAGAGSGAERHAGGFPARRAGPPLRRPAPRLRQRRQQSARPWRQAHG